MADTSSGPADPSLTPREENEEFMCGCAENYRDVCRGEPFYREHEGKRYCVLHYPGTEKAADFAPVLERRLAEENYNFGGVVFPEDVNFAHRIFDNSANFTRTTFHANADFSDTAFNSNVSFEYTKFLGDTNFTAATFSNGARFSHTEFNGEADFINSSFNDNAFFASSTFARGAYFTRANFKCKALFADTMFYDYASFIKTGFGSYTNFKGATFGNYTIFKGTTLQHQTHFSGATFNGEARFFDLEFNEKTLFDRVKFGSEIRFSAIKFKNEARFYGAIFNGGAQFHVIESDRVVFSEAIFKGPASFHMMRRCQNTGTTLDFQFARFEQPESVQFHSMRISSRWFINADPRKFTFLSIEWSNVANWKTVWETIRKAAWKAVWKTVWEVIRGTVRKDVTEYLGENSRRKDLSAKDQRDAAFRLFSVAYRNLALNAEENHQYDTARDFRYRSMEALRRRRRNGGALLTLEWWYWFVSGYGERLRRAFGALAALWLLFAGLYLLPCMNFQPRAAASPARSEAPSHPVTMHWSRTAVYSLAVLSFQRPEPKPANTAAELVVTLENILGPIQIALTALAVRRKFMR